MKPLNVITLGLAIAGFTVGAANAAVIYTLQPDSGPPLALKGTADSSVTASSFNFDEGGMDGGGDRYFYTLAGNAALRTGISETISFSSTTHEFDLTSITWSYYLFSSGGRVDVNVSVNGTDIGTQSTVTTNAFDQILTWDASSVATASTYNLVFSIDEVDPGGAGRATFFELQDQNSTGLVINGDITAIPEPSSAALLGLGGLALILRRRK